MRTDALFQRIAITSESLKKYSTRMLSIIGLTHSQAMILGYLMANTGKKITQKDVEKNFELSHAAVNGFMQRMEKKGFLTTHQDECDKRFKVIEPTEKLVELYESIRHISAIFFAELDRYMPVEEQEMLMYLLEKLESIGKKCMESFMIKETKYEKIH